MAGQWFFARDRKKHGPVTIGQLKDMARRKLLQPSDMVLEEGKPDWIAAGSVPGLFEIQAVPAVGQANASPGNPSAVPAAIPAEQSQCPGQPRAPMAIPLGQNNAITHDPGTSAPRKSPEPSGRSSLASIWAFLNRPIDGSGKRRSDKLVPCKSCGKEIATNAVACPNCGVPGPMALIACKVCGKGIAPNAVACPNCGAPGPGTATSQPAGNDQQKVNAVGGVILLLLLVFGGWYFFGSGRGKRDSESKAIQEGQSAVVVTAADLCREYDKGNEIAADQKYKDQVLEVTGKVEEVSHTFGDATVKLSGATLLGTNLVCHFNGKDDPKLPKLTIGQSAVIRGKCSGIILNNVQLNKCVVVSASTK